MSLLSDLVRKMRIPKGHATRRHFARDVAKGRFDIGDYTFGRPEVLRISGDPCRLIVGHFCSIAPGVKIILGSDHRADWISTYPFQGPGGGDQIRGRGDVVIGSDVWIGAFAIILSGVSIGHGAIIGAGALVSRDVPPYSVAVGNPAQVARKRFPDDVVAALLETEWWNLPTERIRELGPILQSDNIDALVASSRS